MNNVGRMYSATFRSVTVSAVQDLFQLVCASGLPILVHEILLSCRGGNDERLNVMVHRGLSEGSGGTAPTPSPLNSFHSSAVTVVEVNNTSQSNDGAIVESFEWDLRTIAQRLYTPEGRILVPGGGRLCVSLETPPAAGRVMSGTVVFQEIY